MKMLCVNVNSIIYTAGSGAGRNGPFCACVAHFIYIMSVYSSTRFVVWHVHGRMHSDSRWGHASLSFAIA